MGMPGRAPLRTVVGRRVPRCPLAVPVRITVLQPDNPYSIPGRSLDLGEGGLAAVLAGELHAGDPVGVEFLLPDLGLGVQAKAVVRHRGPLRCGFEFQQLTRHQQALLREWTRLMLGGEPREEAPREEVPNTQQTPAAGKKKPSLLQRFPEMQRVVWWVAALLVLAALGAWWNWERQWGEIEQKVPATSKDDSRLFIPAQPTAANLMPPVVWEQSAGVERRAG